MQWPFDEEEDQIGDFVSYVDANYALLQSRNARLFLVDLETMTIEDEVSLLNHQPKPLVELYPSLRGDSGLGSDLSFFLPLPHEHFLSVHQEIRSGYPDGGHDRLLTWQAPE